MYQNLFKSFWWTLISLQKGEPFFLLWRIWFPQTKPNKPMKIQSEAGVALHVWKLIWRPNMKQRLCEAIVATRVATHKEHLRQHVCVSGSCLRHKITVFFKFCEIHAIRFSSTWKRLFWILKPFFSDGSSTLFSQCFHNNVKLIYEN